MGDNDAAAPDLTGGASPMSFEQIVAEMQFFSDSSSLHDELDEIETIASDAGVVDLCSDSEGEEDDEDREPETESDRETTTLHAKAFKLLSRLDMLLRPSRRDPRLTGQQRTFLKAQKGEIREQMTTLKTEVKSGLTMAETDLREAVEGKKQHVQALRDSVASLKLRLRTPTVTDKECLDVINLAIAAVDSMTAPAGTEIAVLDKWAVESWASPSRVNWSAKRYPEAEPAVMDAASTAWAWQQLTTTDAEEQRHRTIGRVEGVRKVSKSIALVKRAISIAPTSTQPARIVEDLAVVFIVWDYRAFYVGMASLPTTKLASELDECQCWVFAPPETKSAGGCRVQYVGFHSVLKSAAASDDAVMDVMDVLSRFESHFEN